MKSFFEDLGKRIGEATETVSAKAGEAVEIQKLKSQIRTLERGNEEDLIDLGRTIYEKFKAGESVGEEEAGLCDAIQSREESIAEYQQKISDVKGDFQCGDCGKIIAKGMTYCPYCGAKVPEPVQAEDAADIVEAAEETADDAEDVVEEAADVVEDAVEEAVEKAADAAEDVAEKVEEAAEVVGEAAAEAAEEVKEKVEDVIE